MNLVLLIILFIAGAVGAGPTVCNECVGVDEASCLAKQDDDQVCANNKDSLGTTHCATAVGKYRDDREAKEGGNITDVFFRGCFDCANKKEACFALGGFLKGDEGWTLLQCEIECCTTNNCNTQVPTLSKDAITVFTPNASGPAECNSCLGTSATQCSENLDDQKCASDSESLGTTHCGSAVGKFRNEDGQVTDGFYRGCINCADKKAACAAIGGFLKDERKLSMLQCEIECCTGNICDNHFPTLPPTGSTSTTPNAACSPDSLQGHHVFFCGVLAFCNILYHFF